jgi:hypothetical protein
MGTAPMAQPDTTDTQSLRIPREPHGIGGWLVLLAAGQVIAPLRQLASLAMYYTKDDVIAGFSKIPIVLWGELTINLTQTAIIFCTSFLFFAHKRLFRTFFTIEVIGIWGFIALDYRSTSHRRKCGRDDMGSLRLALRTCLEYLHQLEIDGPYGR